MKHAGTSRLFFVIGAVSVLAACAAQPQAGSAPAASAAPAAVALTSGQAATSDSKKLPTSGYRRVVKDGTEYFCKRETATGSRTQVFDQCLTEAQLTAMRDGSQDFVRRQQQHVGDAPQPGPSGANPFQSAATEPR